MEPQYKRRGREWVEAFPLAVDLLGVHPQGLGVTADRAGFLVDLEDESSKFAWDLQIVPTRGSSRDTQHVEC